MHLQSIFDSDASLFPKEKYSGGAAAPSNEFCRRIRKFRTFFHLHRARTIITSLVRHNLRYYFVEVSQQKSDIGGDEEHLGARLASSAIISSLTGNSMAENRFLGILKALVAQYCATSHLFASHFMDHTAALGAGA